MTTCCVRLADIAFVRYDSSSVGMCLTGEQMSGYLRTGHILVVGSARVSVDATLLTTHDPARNLSLLVNSLAPPSSSASCKLVRSLLPYSARRFVRLTRAAYSNSWRSKKGSGMLMKNKTRPNGDQGINWDLCLCLKGKSKFKRLQTSNPNF